MASENLSDKIAIVEAFLGVAQYQMALQKVLFDAGVCDQAKFDAALKAAGAKLEPIRTSLASRSAEQLESILRHLAKMSDSSHQA